MRLPTVPNVETTDLRRFLIAVRENLKKLNELYFTEDEYKAATSGSEMAGRPVILNSDGMIDGSMIDDSDAVMTIVAARVQATEPEDCFSGMIWVDMSA